MKKAVEKLIYDVVVIGAGHAGCEAALASAGNNSKTLLITINLDGVLLMPSGNELGGPGKYTIIRKIDSSGGEILKNIKENYINARVEVNKRASSFKELTFLVDERRYSLKIKKVLENQKNLDLRQGLAVGVSRKGDKLELRTGDGIAYGANSIIFCTGSFLGARIFWGKYEIEAGRQGEICSKSLLASLKKMGFKFALRKIFTAPVIDKKTITKKKLEKQSWEISDVDFLYKNGFKSPGGRNIYFSYTDEKFIDFIVKNKDKILYGRDRERQKIGNAQTAREEFFDGLCREGKRIGAYPLGKNTNELYLKGLENDLSEELQLEMIRRISGFGNAEMTRPGYGIEYNYLIKSQVDSEMESKRVKGIFFAGKLNGVDSYEESAEQGVVSGINASKR